MKTFETHALEIQLNRSKLKTIQNEEKNMEKNTEERMNSE